MATRKILLIDDDLSFYGELSQQLSPYGFEVHQCEVSEASLEDADTISAEIVVIAVDLPEKAGFGLCLKAKKSLSIPVVLKTTSVSAEDFSKHQGLKSHADGYLDLRTATSAELIATIGDLVGLGEPAAGTEMEIQDMDEMGIEVEELEMDDIELEDFDSGATDSTGYEDAAASPFDSDDDAQSSEFASEESTRVAAPAAFLDPGLDEETDAAFAAMGIGDSNPFDTSDMVDANMQTMDDLGSDIETSVGMPQDATAVAPDESIETDYEIDDSDPLAQIEDSVQAQKNYELELDDNDAPSEAAVPEMIENEDGVVYENEDSTIAGIEIVDSIPEPLPEAYAEPEPAPEPVAAAAPEPEPEPEPVPEPVAAAAPEPEPEPVPEPVAAAAPEPEADGLDLGLDAIAESVAEEQEAAAAISLEELNELREENARLQAEAEEARILAKKHLAGPEGDSIFLRRTIVEKEEALQNAQKQLVADSARIAELNEKVRTLESTTGTTDERVIALQEALKKSNEGSLARSTNLITVRTQADTDRHQHAAALVANAKAREADKKALEETHAENLRNLMEDMESAQAEIVDLMKEEFALEKAERDAAHAEALAEAGKAHAEQLAQQAQASEQALAQAAAAHAEQLAQQTQAHTQALAEAEANASAKLAASEQKAAGELSALQQQAAQAQEEMQSQHQAALAAAETAHQAAMAEAAGLAETALAQALSEAQGAAEAAAAAAATIAKTNADTAVAQAQEAAAQALAEANAQHEQAVAQVRQEQEQAAEAHAAALASAAEAAEARRKQEQEVAASELEAANEQRRNELSAAAEERAASEAQLLAKAGEDRAALEQEHSEVIARMETENKELQLALSSNRTTLSEKEAELAASHATIAERDAEITSKQQDIATRDDQIAALKSEQSELEQQNAGYQEQVLKAYQKIKTDEGTVSRAKKAMAIALTLLDESTTTNLGNETKAQKEGPAA